MQKLIILILFLCSCGTETEYVGPDGLELYSCGTQLCLEAEINGTQATCIYDTAANGTLWLSDSLGASCGLSVLWSYPTPNRYGPGDVIVSMLSVAEVCIQRNGERDCQEVNPYSTQITGAECLWGLN
jgi:hypothetical protein